jgi:hypothetical protein
MVPIVGLPFSELASASSWASTPSIFLVWPYDRLQTEGVIPVGVKFQISLPTKAGTEFGIRSV